MKSFLPLFILMLTAYSNSSAQISIEQHLLMDQINCPELQPDGNHVLYIKRSKEVWDGPKVSEVFIKDLNSGQTTQLTKDSWDYAPQWSPNGDLLSFISYRDNLQQIYTISPAEKVVRKVSDAQAYISDYQWVNDSIIAYVDDEPRDSKLLAWEAENGGGYIVGTHYYKSALWTVNIHTGSTQKISQGEERIIDFQVSQDGQHFALRCAKNYDYYEAIVHSWVQVIDRKGNEVFRFEDANSFLHIAFSPDNKQLAFTASTIGYACNDGLFVADLASKKVRNLTYDFDPTIQKIQWKDAEHILFSTPKNARTGIYEVDLKGNIAALIAPEQVIYEFDYQNGAIVFSAAKSTQPIQLFHVDLSKKKGYKQLTNMHEDILPLIKTQSSIINFPSYDGTMIEAIVNFPPDYVAGQAYPLMVIPHGGPDAVRMDDFNWEGQYFADQGFVVYQPNFRGSIGYGRAIYAGNRAQFGKKDFEDIMSGVDYLIEKGISDPEQLFIGGGSYGGYMANWAITQTDRFKAAISLAGVSNLVSLYGQHEFSNRAIGVWEYKATPYENVEIYRSSSPIFHLEKVSTPLLILHGERDNRSPTLQAWEMYRAMQDAGKEVKMILYPRAGHSISQPKQFKSVLENWVQFANTNK